MKPNTQYAKDLAALIIERVGFGHMMSNDDIEEFGKAVTDTLAEREIDALSAYLNTYIERRDGSPTGRGNVASGPDELMTE